jgi:DMSO/TMAO reductase YedYZ molybdopterin-dependent catalytic subunit
MLIVAIGFSPSASIGQATQQPSLKVNGELSSTLALSASDLAALPHRSVTVTDDQGAKAVYEGIPIVELLRRAGVPLGKELRGPKMTLCVVATASDGYRAAFTLAEFDPGFTDQVILLADRRDGKPLSAREGPLRIIVPLDKRHARWVREVSSLTVRNVQ